MSKKSRRRIKLNNIEWAKRMARYFDKKGYKWRWRTLIRMASFLPRVRMKPTKAPIPAAKPQTHKTPTGK